MTSLQKFLDPRTVIKVDTKI